MNGDKIKAIRVTQSENTILITTINTARPTIKLNKMTPNKAKIFILLLFFVHYNSYLKPKYLVVFDKDGQSDLVSQCWAKPDPVPI